VSESEKRIVSTSELAEILGLSDRRIRQLEQIGAISKISRGKFNLSETIQQYIDWIKSQAIESDQELDLKKEKTLLTRANRQKVELEIQIMRGELHRSEDVQRVMNDMLGAFRARCLAIPTKAAPRLIAETDIAIIQDTLRKEIYEALSELSGYDPNVFYKQSKDKLVVDMGLDDDEFDDEKVEVEVKGNGGSGKKAK
jgi:phage terminase Nu1 subunit (DNA packaging protein)